MINKKSDQMVAFLFMAFVYSQGSESVAILIPVSSTAAG